MILLLLGQVQWMILSLLVVTNLPLLSLHPRSSSSTFSPILFANAAFITSRRRSKLSAPCGVPLRPASISVATFCMRWRSLLFSFLDCVAPCTPQRGNLGPRCHAWRFFLSDLAYRRLASVGAAVNPPLLQVCPPSIVRLRDSMGLQSRHQRLPCPTSPFVPDVQLRELLNTHSSVPTKHHARLFPAPNHMPKSLPGVHSVQWID